MIERDIKVYKCNYKKNDKCNKTCCQFLDGIHGCTNTTKWRYAKGTPLNYMKRIINYFIRGKGKDVKKRPFNRIRYKCKQRTIR